MDFFKLYGMISNELSLKAHAKAYPITATESYSESGKYK